LTAGFSTAPADLSASFHLCIIAHLFAFLGALVANVSANLADARVILGPDQHEIRACIADIRAFHQKPDVLRHGVLAAFGYAVHHRLEACPIAVKAVLDALLHFLRHVHMVCHGKSPLIKRKSRQRWAAPHLNLLLLV
jgi:hypothetical protein